MDQKLNYGIQTVERLSSSRSEIKKLYPYNKVVLLKKGSKLLIDFDWYICKSDTIYFINPNQHFTFQDSNGVLLFFDPDFYCIEIHDNELACDGILYSNVFSTTSIPLTETVGSKVQFILQEIQTEMQSKDFWTNEKIRLLIKYIIIECTREWVKLEGNKLPQLTREQEISRQFSVLVDKYHRQIHNIHKYAEKMNLSTKTLHKYISTNYGTSPGCILANKIILEAKKLLVHTTLSVKEVAFKLGYSDASYFNRYFKQQTQSTPLQFRKAYQERYK